MFPILSALILSGSIRVEWGVYVGTASDGERLALPGSPARPDQTEAYLRDFPTPDKW